MRTGKVCGHLVAAGFALSLGGCLSVGQGSSSGGAGGVSATTPPPPPVTQEAPNGRKVVVATSGGTDTRVPLSAAAKRKLRGRAAVSFVVRVTVGGKPFATQTIRVVR